MRITYRGILAARARFALSVGVVSHGFTFAAGTALGTLKADHGFTLGRGATDGTTVELDRPLRHTAAGARPAFEFEHVKEIPA